MKSWLQISRLIDAMNERVGRNIYWLILAAVLVSAINASVRKAFDMSSNAFLEMQWYMFSAVFLLGSGYTLLRQEHIRIDVIYGRFSRRTQVWIDIFGTVLFLLPMCLMFLYLSWPFFVHSFQSGEVSVNAGGLILWPVKGLMPLGFLLLTLQGISELIKRIAFQAGLAPDPGEKKQDKSAEEELAEAIKAHLVAPEVVDIVATHDAMHADRKDGSAP
ncbi:MAG: TRAP transporter small permease subunit [Proteobacteria bacterium]|nr:TRAP transporter small permease subunit [Pseudomonadota bacterium]